MSETFLQEILRVTRSRVESQKRSVDLPKLRASALSIRSAAESQRFLAALSAKNGVNIIAEIKRASPSKGIINEQIDVAEVAERYEAGGACSISVLTEETFFKGLLDDLRVVRQTVDLPILRKDFIVDEFQIYEAAEAGADAILLIVAALTAENLKYFLRLVENDLGMDALVEVHTLKELQIAIDIGAKIIGINNRDLHSFNVSLDVSRDLIRHRPPNTLIIAESGLSTPDEIEELKALGFNAFLIGETFMRSGNVVNELRKLGTQFTESAEQMKPV